MYASFAAVHGVLLLYTDRSIARLIVGEHKNVNNDNNTVAGRSVGRERRG